MFIPIVRIPRAASVDNQGAGRRPTGRIARYHGFYPWGSSKSYKNIYPSALFFLLLSFIFVLPDSYANRNALFDGIEAPTLLYPVTEAIDLSGKDSLEFKWIKTPGMFVYYTEFKLYKSANNFASDLIYKENIQPGSYPAKVPVTYFEEGQVYSWTLRIVLTDGNRTEIAYSPFKVIKK